MRSPTPARGSDGRLTGCASVGGSPSVVTVLTIVVDSPQAATDVARQTTATAQPTRRRRRGTAGIGDNTPRKWGGPQWTGNFSIRPGSGAAAQSNKRPRGLRLASGGTATGASAATG